MTINTCCAYLRERAPKLETFAEVVGKRPRTLQRNFQEGGFSYSDLIETTRFEMAIEMLKNPAAPLIEIAMNVGYENQSNFGRSFKRISGMSPGAYRRQMLEQGHLATQKANSAQDRQPDLDTLENGIGSEQAFAALHPDGRLGSKAAFSSRLVTRQLCAISRRFSYLGRELIKPTVLVKYLWPLHRRKQLLSVVVATSPNGQMRIF